MTAERILDIARGEIGTVESAPGRVKYNTEYYGRPVTGSGYAWCAAFIWWCFRVAGASELYYGGNRTAYCPTLLSFHRKQAVTGGYQPGDIIFFNFSGGKTAGHVGICESWDGRYITTIDGNTWTGNEANGGRVMRRKREKGYIIGAYRPEYKEEDNDMLSYEQWKAYMEQYRKELGALPAPQWAEQTGEWDKAEKSGIIADKSRPQDLITRAEAAAMVVRATAAK